MSEALTDPRQSPHGSGWVDALTARLLKTPWLMRMPIPLYRAGLGWIFGSRLVMIEHLGRSSNEPRYVVMEVVERERNAVRVASGFGKRSQWYQNLRANGVAFLSTGRARRTPAAVTLLDAAESKVVLSRYAVSHPRAWRRLSAAMEYDSGGEAEILIVEFSPPAGGG